MATRTAPGTWTYDCKRTQCGVCFRVGTPEGLAGSHGNICLYHDDTSLEPHTREEVEARAQFIVLADHHFDAMEKALRQLVDKNLTFIGRQVTHGVHIDDVCEARELLKAIDAERNK